MTTVVRAAVTALAFVLVPLTSASAQKVAYINSQKIIARTPGFAEADAQLKKENEQYQAQIKLMGDSLNALVSAYQKSEATLTPSAKSAKQDEIRGRQTAYQQRVQEMEQRARGREQQLVKPLMDRINKIIEDMRAQDGYAMVFDAGNTSGVVVAADTTLDTTEKVITKLQAMGPVATTPPAAGGTTDASTGAAAAKAPAGSATKPTGVQRPKTPPSGR